jgi:hypothetical protein
MALVWALLPNKTRATYAELFSAIRDAFVAKFGNTGKRRVFLTDYELAAIDAVKEVFPTDTNKGCTFHFRQALMRRVQGLGLGTAYSSGAPEVRQWIRQIMGLTLAGSVCAICLADAEAATGRQRYRSDDKVASLQCVLR